jgi:hypothetical protein
MLEDLTSAVHDETSVEKSCEMLLHGLWGHIKAAIASNNLAGVDQLVNEAMHGTPALCAAVTANTGSAANPAVPAVSEPAAGEDEGKTVVQYGEGEPETAAEDTQGRDSATGRYT